MFKLVQDIEKSQMKSMPVYTKGDTLRIDVLIQEGDKKRIQAYTGMLIGQHKAAHRSTITVRKLSKTVGVERVFPIYSPDIKGITLVPTKQRKKKKKKKKRR